MEHWVMEPVDLVTAIHITEDQEIIESALEFLFLVGTGVGSEEVLLVYVECV
jgi:RNA binding exosome subunit